MNMQPNIGPPRDDDEMQTVCEMLTQCFSLPTEMGTLWCERMTIDDIRLNRSNNRVASMLQIIPMGQWFGGQRIDMAGIAAVCTKPEFRDEGLADQLLMSMLEELYEQNCPLSVLYPATRYVYRRVGYEIAGHSMETRLRLREVRGLSSTLHVQPITDDDAYSINLAYNIAAAHSNGMVDRNDYMWLRVHVPRGIPSEGYKFVRDGHVEGYMYLQMDRGDSLNFTLHIRDWVALSPDAVKASFKFISRYRSLVSDVSWVSGPGCGMHQMLSEKSYTQCEHVGWMVRIVSVEHALASRGYSPNVRAELHFDIADDRLPQNSGRWLMKVADGTCHVERGGRGAIKIDIRGLSALFTGFMAPMNIKLAGQMDGSEVDLIAAGSVFAGPAPFMMDQF